MSNENQHQAVIRKTVWFDIIFNLKEGLNNLIKAQGDQVLVVLNMEQVGIPSILHRA